MWQALVLVGPKPKPVGNDDMCRKRWHQHKHVHEIRFKVFYGRRTDSVVGLIIIAIIMMISHEVGNPHNLDDFVWLFPRWLDEGRSMNKMVGHSTVQHNTAQKISIPRKFWCSDQWANCIYSMYIVRVRSLTVRSFLSAVRSSKSPQHQ